MLHGKQTHIWIKVNEILSARGRDKIIISEYIKGMKKKHIRILYLMKVK